MKQKTKLIDLYSQELRMLLSMPVLAKKQNSWTEEQYKNRVTELQELIELSKRGKSNRLKGSSYERDVAKKFKEYIGVDLHRTPQSGGFAKKSVKADDFRGDIVCLESDKKLKIHIEVKNHATWKLKDWIDQAESDCPEGLYPIVVMHRRQTNKEGKRVQECGDYVTLRLEDFLDLCKDKLVEERK